ncbi:MAG: putative manganese transporter [Bacilli bacterium]|jgi:hypothetical protein
MIDIIIDTLVDSLKLFPFLFFVFLLLEYIEHRVSNKSKKLVEKSNNYGPLIGSILGAFPQCGFSSAASNLYAARIISIGTLISIYLSTSDEMLPILISEKADPILILKIIALKVLIGMVCGFIIDLIIRKPKKDNNQVIAKICEEEHCNCKGGIFKSSIKHSLHIVLFIFIISFFLNTALFYLGEDTISNIFMKDSIIGPFIASLVGLVPNCGSSVIITQLYLSSAITFGSMMAGLLTNSGVALLVLFKINKNIKANIKIVVSMYGIGVISGIIIDVINIII